MTIRAVAPGLLVLLTISLLALPVAADYTGGPLGVADHGTVAGEVLVTHGDSRYSGEVAPGGTYAVTFPVDLPAGASVRTASVYLFWTWSHAGTTGVPPDLEAESSDGTLSPPRSYTDRKGRPPYDYPSGLYVYDVSWPARGGAPLTLTVTNTAPEAGVAFAGAVLLIVYESGGPSVSYWIAEGAEMIYAAEGVIPEQATARIAFNGVPAVPPGGNKGQNTLTVNDREFPGLFDGSPYADLAVNSTEIGPLLVPGTNTVALRDEGDYMVPGLFVLTVRKGEGASTATPTQGAPAPVLAALVATAFAAAGAVRTRCRRG